MERNARCEGCHYFKRRVDAVLGRLDALACSIPFDAMGKTGDPSKSGHYNRIVIELRAIIEELKDE